MRLFRKTINKADKGKKNAKNTENQYEYVRKEFGFDYVPPSQYVPSHSLSEDDEDGEEIEHDDTETFELQYQGASPVKIIQPRSELSGSVQPEDDIYVPRKSIRKVHHANPQHVRKLYQPTRSTHLLPEKEEEEVVLYDPDERELTRNRQHRTIPSIRENPRNPPQRRTTATEEAFRSKGSNRSHRPEPGFSREEHDRETHRTRHYRSEDDVDDLGDLDIERVQTAFSYNSDDSAESLVEEQSRGSRYNATHNKKGHRSSRHSRPSKSEGKYPENDLDDYVVIRTTSWRKTRNGWERESDERGVQEPRPHLEEYERPRYDRKHKIQRETREDNPNDYRRDIYDNDMRESTRRHFTRHQEFRYSTKYRTNSGMDDRRDGPEISRKSHHPRHHDLESNEKETHGRRRGLGDASYYATPSGKMASDYDATGPIDEPRVSQQKHSKGFLGRIRESVRGPPKKEKKRYARGDDTYLVEERPPKEVPYVKPSALFEQVQPSLRSDVSFQDRTSSKFHRREPDVPSTLPRTKVVSHPPRNRHEYGPDPAYDERSDGGNENAEAFNTRRRSSHRPRHRDRPSGYSEHFDDPRRVREEDYWESPEAMVSRQLAAERRKALSSSALPFETARNETPALRHNPDHRRSYTRQLVKSNHDHRGYGTDDPERYSSAQELRYATLSSPKLIREHPTLSNDVQPTNSKGFRIGCY
ncbi:hypothetical protein IV203_000696 [Nitzschia inconspicua]|uniref:Uncharacterized protein n=1 Tax=Nitzschia inconspicua TaxID=303405 RepID=A0A9K3L6W0_9STRA|nr:hypothetical protein IV203_000696 [Nitzschia inconspicua]